MHLILAFAVFIGLAFTGSSLLVLALSIFAGAAPAVFSRRLELLASAYAAVLLSMPLFFLLVSTLRLVPPFLSLQRSDISHSFCSALPEAVRLAAYTAIKRREYDSFSLAQIPPLMASLHLFHTRLPSPFATLRTLLLGETATPPVKAPLRYELLSP